MNRERLDLLPTELLRPRRDGCRLLEEWLHARGWRLTLLELDTERRRRNLPTAWGRHIPEPNERNQP